MFFDFDAPGKTEKLRENRGARRRETLIAMADEEYEMDGGFVNFANFFVFRFLLVVMNPALNFIF